MYSPIRVGTAGMAFIKPLSYWELVSAAPLRLLILVIAWLFFVFLIFLGLLLLALTTDSWAIFNTTHLQCQWTKLYLASIQCYYRYNSAPSFYIEFIWDKPKMYPLQMYPNRFQTQTILYQLLGCKHADFCCAAGLFNNRSTGTISGTSHICFIFFLF